MKSTAIYSLLLFVLLAAGCAAPRSGTESASTPSSVEAWKPPSRMPSQQVQDTLSPDDDTGPRAMVSAPRSTPESQDGTMSLAEEQGKTTEALPEEAPKRRGFFGRREKKEKEEPETKTATQVPPVEMAAEAAPGQKSSGGTPSPENAIYKLKNGDTVFIYLSGAGGLSEQIETVIDTRGNVKLRFIGAVKASGLSATELETEIEAEYIERQKIYRSLVARVVVPNTFYFIGGEVRSPGRFPLAGRVTLSQALVAAGNFTEWANPKKIVLVRNNERRTINYRDIVENPALDVELKAGDIVTVERTVF